MVRKLLSVYFFSRQDMGLTYRLRKQKNPAAIGRALMPGLASCSYRATILNGKNIHCTDPTREQFPPGYNVTGNTGNKSTKFLHHRMTLI